MSFIDDDFDYTEPNEDDYCPCPACREEREDEDYDIFDRDEELHWEEYDEELETEEYEYEDFPF